jgi:hypothetical protein
MKPAKPKTAIALMLLATAAGSLGQAQPPLPSDTLPLTADADVPPNYVVEFLIFAYNDFNPVEEEFAPEAPHWPESLTDVRLTSMPETLPSGSADWYLDTLTAPADPAADYPAAAANPGSDAATTANAAVGAPVDEYGNTIGSTPAPVDEGHWYRMLAPDELELGRAFARLNALDAYTPLLHAGWSQATLYEDEAQPFELAWLGKLQPAGSIRLHRSRFLHLTLDVSLQDNYRYWQAPLAADASWPLAEFLRPLTYHIDIQRRVRSGELHFFDHPAFGVLVMIRPAPEIPDPAGSNPTGPAA